MIKLSYFCQGTVIYLTLITLLSSYLETVVTEIEMKRQNDEKEIIWVRLPYFWQAGDKMKKSCFRKVQKCLTKNVCFFPYYETKKPAMFCSAKDFIPTLQKLNVVYCSTCPECNEKYIDKTGCNLVTHLYKHGSLDDQPMYQHLSKCEHYNDTANLMKYWILIPWLSR